MQYRRLGSTNMRVSVVGVGTWQFGGEWGQDFAQEQADAVLDQAASDGINLIDTAECYGDHLSESLIGNWLKNQKREDWVVATKFGHRFHGFMDRTDDYRLESVQKQLEGSLKALQTDYVDLYQFHSGNDESFATEGLWEMLRGLKESGKVRHLGISITTSDKVDTLGQVKAAREVGAETIQVYYNRLTTHPEDDVLPACQRDDLGVLARVPLASGFLTGKYKPGDDFGDQDIRSKKDKEKRDKELEKVQEIERTEVPDGVPMAQWAVAWCLKHPAVSCVIPGCRTAEQAAGNAKAADLTDLVRPDHPQAWK